MNEIPKTTRELRKMGITSSLVGTVVNFQKSNQLNRIEMLQLLQDCQLYIIENIILEMKEDAE